MSVKDQANVEWNIHPVRMALAKVSTYLTCLLPTYLSQICKMAFKIINLPTLLLPAWETTCKEAGLATRQIPWDVSTHWNSSFDMVNFVVDYRIPVDAMVNKQKLGLGNYALDKHEWKVLGQLWDVLAVSKLLQCCYHVATMLRLTNQHLRSWRMQPYSSRVEPPTLPWLSQPWITLTKSSWQACSTSSALIQPFVLQLDFPRTLSTNTTGFSLASLL